MKPDLQRDDCVSILQSTSASSACHIWFRNRMAAASEISVVALAVNSLMPPTGARITTNVLVPPTCARTRHKRFGSTDRYPYSPKGAGSTERSTNKPIQEFQAVRCTQTNIEYSMSAVDPTTGGEGGGVSYA